MPFSPDRATDAQPKKIYTVTNLPARAKLAGRFPELEDELAGLTYGGGYEGPGRSPDRADAMVWAMSELIRPRAEPRIRLL